MALYAERSKGRPSYWKENGGKCPLYRADTVARGSRTTKRAGLTMAAPRCNDPSRRPSSEGLPHNRRHKPSPGESRTCRNCLSRAHSECSPLTTTGGLAAETALCFHCPGDRGRQSRPCATSRSGSHRSGQWLFRRRRKQRAPRPTLKSARVEGSGTGALSIRVQKPAGTPPAPFPVTSREWGPAAS